MTSLVEVSAAASSSSTSSSPETTTIVISEIDSDICSVPSCSNDVTSSSSTIENSFNGQDFNCSTLDICLNEIEVTDNNNKRIDVIELSEECHEEEIIKINGDGSDSGVDIGGIIVPINCILQRALSSNSGGYSSSCGLEEIPGTVSCDSSMISYCSDICDNNKIAGSSSLLLGRNNSSNDCCTSEGGSESSSVTGGPVTAVRKSSSIKKKVAVQEPANNVRQFKRNDSLTSSVRSRSRASSVNRNLTTNKPSPSQMSTRERARSRDKVMMMPPSPKNTPSSGQNRSVTTNKRPPKPDSFPIDIKDPASPAIQRIRGSRTPSITRGRTPGTTPTDDGRWPSVGGKSGSGTPKSGKPPLETITIKTRVGALSLEQNKMSSSSTFDKYATLPRRRREKSADDLKQRSPRSSSITRDRMTASTFVRRQTSRDSTTPPTTTKTLPPYPKPKRIVPKIKIYHEMSVQTAITLKDVEDGFSGVAKNIRIDAAEMVTKETQSDIRDKEMEKLEDKFNKMIAENTALQTTLFEKSQRILIMEQELIQERVEKLAAQKELHSNSERVLAMLESVHVPSNDDDVGGDGGDSLLILESQIQKSEHILERQEEELCKWKKIYINLQNDMEKSLLTQKNLINQRDLIEQESNELQEFLKNENTTLADSLKEVEIDLETQIQKNQQKEFDLERLQEECRHLVRIIEQKRQENKGLQTKYNGLEASSRELLLQQGTAVSGASIALGSISTRLDSLVEQLISSYNISEQELEDVIYHNEAYTNSGSSGEGSPEYEFTTTHSKIDDGGSLSPQRSHSFIAAVISAIRNATSSAKHTVQSSKKDIVISAAAVNTINDDSDSTEMLDSETEPCLMMENVLEDVPMPDSHSHNLVSASSGLVGVLQVPHIEVPNNEITRHGESLHNLSQAIENRQQIELQTSIMANRSVQHNLILRQQSDQSTSEDISVHESLAELPSISDFCTAQSLVDQVIEVDNLITKLLKVLRIIQMDNDNCIQQLIGDKNKLQLNKEEMMEQIREWEKMNFKLKDELKETSQQLVVRGSDLANSKIELQKHRLEIDRLNEDICNLSTLCSQNMNNSNSNNQDEYLSILKAWQEHGTMPEPKVLTHILNACNEIPTLKEKLIEKESQINEMTNNLSSTKHFMTSSWHNAVTEAKRQYEAIDRALETLNSIQSIVQQCPALAQLQRDLEETNFQSASSLPLSTAILAATNGSDFNANANGIQINGDNNTGNHHINLTA